MNSEPSCSTSGITRGTTAKLTSSVVHRQRRASRRIGAYTAPKRREIGLRDSGRRRRPRTRIVIIAGTSVIASSAEHVMANVFVKASGRNNRPSCASSMNTGTNETMMIASEKKIARPTWRAASTTRAGCCA